MSDKDTKYEVNKADFENTSESKWSSSDRIKEVKPKTLKQQWQFERSFNNAGSLAAVKTILRRMALAKSTLPIESEAINEALAHLKCLNFRYNLEESWRRYEERSKEE